MNAERQELHSVWLCPEDAKANALQSVISRIAERQDAPTFYPHVTLLGEISGTPDTTSQACKALFANGGTIEATVLRVARSAEFFKSLTLELALPQAIFDARAALSQKLSQTKAPLFQPHLSLAYGAAAHCDPDSALQEQLHAFVGMTFLLDRVVVTHSANSIPISLWSALEEIPLRA